MKTSSTSRPEQTEAAAHNHIAFNKGSALAALTPAQQEQLFDWLETYPAAQVLDKIAAPPPDGFSINTHLTTLRRFHARARALFRKQLREDAQQLADEPDSPASGSDTVTMMALRQAALELSTLQQTSPASFTAVARWLLRLKEAEQRDTELQLHRERLALEKEKFEFNAARLAAGHFNEIKEVMTENQGDDEDKIWAIREKIFGPRSALIEPKE